MGRRGIRVNAVAPCWFQTDMNATSIFANERFMEQVMTKLPMKRIGQPQRTGRADRVLGQPGIIDDHRAGPARRRRRPTTAHRVETRVSMRCS